MRYILICIFLMVLVLGGCTKIDELRYGETRSDVIHSSDGMVSSPSAIRLKSGELFLVFRATSETNALDGNILLISSENGRKNWSPPDTIVDTSWDCRDPSITQLQDGLIIVSFFQSRYDMDTEDVRSVGCFTVRSFDNGKTFTSPRMIPIDGFNGTASSDAIVELDDGILILPVYGAKEGEASSVFAVMSENGGETWEDVYIIADASEEGIGYEKPAILRLPEGKILCMMEIHGQTGSLYQTVSEDGGRTWSAPVRSGIVGQNPDLLLTPEGTVLCVYQDLWPAGVSFMRSYDWGRTWEQESSLFGTEEGEASPCLVHLGDGLLAAYYSCPVKKDMASDELVQLGVTFFPFMRPETPKGFTASYGDSKGVRLRWNSVKQAHYYIVYRDTAADFEPQSGYPSAGNGIATMASSGFFDTAVDTGKTYYYRVSAVAGFGELMPGTGSESRPTEVLGVEIQGRNK